MANKSLPLGKTLRVGKVKGTRTLVTGVPPMWVHSNHVGRGDGTPLNLGICSKRKRTANANDPRIPWLQPCGVSIPLRSDVYTVSIYTFFKPTGLTLSLKKERFLFASLKLFSDSGFSVVFDPLANRMIEVGVPQWKYPPDHLHRSS
jgi:hypothetical protein